MKNYETMIIDHLIGTPKDKYEYLIKLGKENAEMRGVLSNIANTFEALSETANRVEEGYKYAIERLKRNSS